MNSNAIGLFEGDICKMLEDSVEIFNFRITILKLETASNVSQYVIRKTSYSNPQMIVHTENIV